jgi:hypothetical protein
MLPEKELLAANLAAARKAQAEAEPRAEETEKTAAAEPAEPQKLATAPKLEPKPLDAPKAPAPEVAPKAPAPTAAPKAPPAAEVPKRAAPPERPKTPAQAEPPKPTARPFPPRAEPEKAAAKKPSAASTPEPAPATGGGVDWLTRGGVAAAVLVVLLAVVLVLRRRALPNDLAVTALVEDERDKGAILDGGFAMGEEAAPVPQEPIASDTPIPVEESLPSAPEPVAGPGLFDDEPEKEDETMDIETPGMPMERTESELPTQIGAGAAGDGDVARLVRELERRVAQLETRLDESVDARERLERQVAAQSEELRVQRAAIARTQRALRSLNRGEEEQATEPALRKPSS